MPSFYYSCESGELRSFIEEMTRGKSNLYAAPATLTNRSPFGIISKEDVGSSLEPYESNYAKLADHLKSCLDYCSFACRRYSVEKGKLVRLLLAEGLIQENPGDIMEDTATKIIQELIDLGMLEEVYVKLGIKVPDKYSKLCLLKEKKEDFVAHAANSAISISIEEDENDNPPNFHSLPVRYLSVITPERRNSVSGPTRRLSRAYLEAVCRLKFLAVLDIDGKIECLPDEVGDLIHLTYLELSCSGLRELPRTLGNLQKLQTLDISLCQLLLHELPAEVLNIKHLRHLRMSHCLDKGEVRVPKGIGAMANLHTCYGVYAGGGVAGELGALTQLRELGVKRFSEDYASELSAAIMKMENLVSLSLEAEDTIFREENEGRTLFPSLEPFCPPPLIQKLYLQGSLLEIPSWIASMNNLTRLYLSFTWLPENPICILQFFPKLKHLTLWQADKAKLIGKEFCQAGGFPVLETLVIASGVLVEWTEIVNGAFPSLRYLSFRNCLNLRFLPEGLQNISTLQEMCLIPLHPDLERRLEGEENYKIKNISELWTHTNF